MEENAAVNAVNEAAAGTFQVRTDLALEQRESSMGEGGDLFQSSFYSGLPCSMQFEMHIPIFWPRRKQ